MRPVVSAGVVVLAITLSLAACSTVERTRSMPRVDAIVDQGVILRDLADLDRMATAVAIVEPTGKARIEYFEAAKGVPSTPFPIVELRVVEAIKGRLPELFELRQGYTYVDQKGNIVPVVSEPGQYLLYLEPYTLGDGSPNNGQWVTVAWLSGVFIDLGLTSGTFTRVDTEATMLPAALTREDALRTATGGG